MTAYLDYLVGTALVGLFARFYGLRAAIPGVGVLVVLSAICSPDVVNASKLRLARRSRVGVEEVPLVEHLQQRYLGRN